jgi:hypothetical protein
MAEQGSAAEITDPREKAATEGSEQSHHEENEALSEVAHPDVVSSASDLGRQDAAAQVLTSYLSAARFATRRKLVTLFQWLLNAEEIGEPIKMLATIGGARRSQLGNDEMIVADGS